VVRLSLGDNEELGDSVRGSFYRWFFFLTQPFTLISLSGARRQMVVNAGEE
jgi:hypothetical protein